MQDDTHITRDTSPTGNNGDGGVFTIGGQTGSPMSSPAQSPRTERVSYEEMDAGTGVTVIQMVTLDVKSGENTTGGDRDVLGGMDASPSGSNFHASASRNSRESKRLRRFSTLNKEGLREALLYDRMTWRGVVLGAGYAFITASLSAYNLVFSKVRFASIFSAHLMMLAQVSGELVKTSITSTNQFTKPIPYIFIGALVLCNGTQVHPSLESVYFNTLLTDVLFAQIYFLNATLRKFDALFIIPVYQVLFVPSYLIVLTFVYFGIRRLCLWCCPF
jgi:hypothetical protein